MEAFLSNYIRAKKVVFNTSDGTPSMVRTTSGFIQLFITDAKQVIQFHCIIHQEALWTKDNIKKLDKILKDVTNMVNFIMACTVNC